ncbi:MAG TPA: phage portal protein, partial [Phycisphaerae bacterium]|nr:phage portal protein [Phycisphaerae bacterium]
DDPNPWMSAQTLRETLMGHALTWGNGYAEIERDNAGKPIALWPLRPDRTMPELVKATDGKQSLVYRVTTDSGPDVILFPDELFHVHGLGFDGLKGYSVLELASETIGMNKALEQFGAAFFGNGAMPGGVLVHPASLDDEARKNLRASLEAMHKGATNAHRLALLEEGLQWQQIGIPAKDAQFLESRKFGVTEVARWFNIAPHMIGDLDRATFSNIEQQFLEFLTMTLSRWLRRWEHEGRRKLFSSPMRRKYFLEFITEGILRGDTQTRYAAYHTAVMDGWLTRNEVRERENLNPLPGLDEPLVPNANAVPADKDKPDDELPPTKPAPPIDEPDADDDAPRALVLEAAQRVLTGEVKAVRKALKKGAVIAGVYEKHLAWAQSVLAAPLAVACGDVAVARTAVDEWVKRHQTALIGAATALEREALLSQWEAGGAADLVSHVFSEEK